MSRDNSPLIVGDYWLDKRRDGKAPEIWQIATPHKGAVVYRSTKRRDVEEAKAVLRAHEAKERSKTNQVATEAEILPHLFNYLREHGPDVHRLDTVKSSFRAWIGFLMQDDELDTDALVSDINKASVARFRRWRMAPHGWEVPWDGKMYRHTSKGVSGEAVQRNIEDLRAALNHAQASNRIDILPKVPSVDRKLRSRSRKHVFTVKVLGAMVAYADHEPEVQAWLWLMISTAARPDAALAFDPKSQWHDEVIDLHPAGRPLTNKRNAIVPVIAPLRDLLGRWPDTPAVKSRKRWWNTMRGKLSVPATHIPKTIRHTVASYLRDNGVPGEQISSLLGHKFETDTLERTSEIYAHATPQKMRAAIRALTKLWAAIDKEAERWRSDHLMTITANNDKIIVARKAGKV